MHNPDTYFISSAVDYYVAGRYAVFAGLNPTAGNLLHHAVEMCLKAGLAKKGKSLAELKRLNHRLPDIWNQFKTHFPGHSLGAFDSLIGELHRFEEIRYPDSIVSKGMLCAIDPGKRPQVSQSPSARTEPQYALYLGEIDELMVKLFSVASFSLPAFFGRLMPTAKSYLHERNEVYPGGTVLPNIPEQRHWLAPVAIWGALRRRLRTFVRV